MIQTLPISSSNHKSVLKLVAKNPLPNIVRVYEVKNTHYTCEITLPIVSDISNNLIPFMNDCYEQLLSLNIVNLNWRSFDIGQDEKKTWKLTNFEYCGVFSSGSQVWLDTSPCVYAGEISHFMKVYNPIDIGKIVFEKRLDEWSRFPPFQ
jgi:hypothetical protein